MKRNMENTEEIKKKSGFEKNKQTSQKTNKKIKNSNLALKKMNLNPIKKIEKITSIISKNRKKKIFSNNFDFETKNKFSEFMKKNLQKVDVVKRNCKIKLKKESSLKKNINKIPSLKSPVVKNEILEIKKRVCRRSEKIKKKEIIFPINQKELLQPYPYFDRKMTTPTTSKEINFTNNFNKKKNYDLKNINQIDFYSSSNISYSHTDESFQKTSLQRDLTKELREKIYFSNSNKDVKEENNLGGKIISSENSIKMKESKGEEISEFIRNMEGTFEEKEREDKTSQLYKDPKKKFKYNKIVKDNIKDMKDIKTNQSQQQNIVIIEKNNFKSEKKARGNLSHSEFKLESIISKYRVDYEKPEISDFLSPELSKNLLKFEIKKEDFQDIKTENNSQNDDYKNYKKKKKILNTSAKKKKVTKNLDTVLNKRIFVLNDSDKKKITKINKSASDEYYNENTPLKQIRKKKISKNHKENQKIMKDNFFSHEKKHENEKGSFKELKHIDNSVKKIRINKYESQNLKKDNTSLSLNQQRSFYCKKFEENFEIYKKKDLELDGREYETKKKKFLNCIENVSLSMNAFKMDIENKFINFKISSDKNSQTILNLRKRIYSILRIWEQLNFLDQDIESHHLRLEDLKKTIREHKTNKINLDKKIDYNHKMIKLNNIKNDTNRKINHIENNIKENSHYSDFLIKNKERKSEEIDLIQNKNIKLIEKIENFVKNSENYYSTFKNNLNKDKLISLIDVKSLDSLFIHLEQNNSKNLNAKINEKLEKYLEENQKDFKYKTILNKIKNIYLDISKNLNESKENFLHKYPELEDQEILLIFNMINDQNESIFEKYRILLKSIQEKIKLKMELGEIIKEIEETKEIFFALKDKMETTQYELKNVFAEKMCLNFPITGEDTKSQKFHHYLLTLETTYDQNLLSTIEILDIEIDNLEKKVKICQKAIYNLHSNKTFHKRDFFTKKNEFIELLFEISRELKKENNKIENLIEHSEVTQKNLLISKLNENSNLIEKMNLIMECLEESDFFKRLVYLKNLIQKIIRTEFNKYEYLEATPKVNSRKKILKSNSSINALQKIGKNSSSKKSPKKDNLFELSKDLYLKYNEEFQLNSRSIINVLKEGIIVYKLKKQKIHNLHDFIDLMESKEATLYINDKFEKYTLFFDEERKEFLIRNGKSIINKISFHNFGNFKIEDITEELLFYKINKENTLLNGINIYNKNKIKILDKFQYYEISFTENLEVFTLIFRNFYFFLCSLFCTKIELVNLFSK